MADNSSPATAAPAADEAALVSPLASILAFPKGAGWMDALEPERALEVQQNPPRKF